VLTKLALGGNRQRVVINGSTTQIDTATGESQTSTVGVANDGEGGAYTGGGLLAQRSNIGEHTQNAFALVPELGLTLGYEFNAHCRATLGYTLLLWTNVVRPGEQIDLSVNPALLPDEQSPVTGAVRPAFAFARFHALGAGFNLGLQCTW